MQARVVHAAGRHEPQAAVDLGGHRLVALPGRGVEHEVLVPVVHLRQRGHAAAGQRPGQVHRRARVGVGADQPGRVVLAGLLGGDQRVDHVPAVAGQAERVGGRRARLGVLPGQPAELDHRHARAVGQHHRHLQQGADVAADVRLGVVMTRLRAVPALQQERLPARDLGQLLPQPVHLGGHGHRRHALQHLADGGDLLLGPLGLLGGGQLQRLVQAGAHLGGQRRQFRQFIDRNIDGPIHRTRIGPGCDRFSFGRPGSRRFSTPRARSGTGRVDQYAPPSLRWSQLITRVGVNRIPTRLGTWARTASRPCSSRAPPA